MIDVRFEMMNTRMKTYEDQNKTKMLEILALKKAKFQVYIK